MNTFYSQVKKGYTTIPYMLNDLIEQSNLFLSMEVQCTINRQKNLRF